jgi:hypothetical protein
MENVRICVHELADAQVKIKYEDQVNLPSRNAKSFLLFPPSRLWVLMRIEDTFLPRG